MYTLTEEGKKYLENGLPEKRLIEKLKQGPVSMKDAQKMEDFSVAIQWVKRNGWVSVEKGIISLAKFDGKIGLQTALEMIKEGKTDDFTLPILLSRKLVETERDDIVKKAEKYIGKEIADVPPELIKTGLWKKANLKKYNVTVTGKKIFPGRKHHYGAFLDHVKRKLAFMGFQEMEGPLVETEF